MQRKFRVNPALRKGWVNPVRNFSLSRAGARGFTSNGIKITVSKASVKDFALGLASGTKEDINSSSYCKAPESDY
jgi:hypothetical protein